MKDKKLKINQTGYNLYYIYCGFHKHNENIYQKQ